MFCVVVDDSKEYCAFIRRVLREHFADEVHIERDYFSAYSYMTRTVEDDRYPDIVFVDFDLREEKNGLDLIQEFRRINDLSSYVLITNSDDAELLTKTAELDVLLVPKSVDLETGIIKASFHAISKLTKQRSSALLETVKQRRRVFELSTELAHEMMSIAQAISDCCELVQLRAVDDGYWDEIADVIESIDLKVDEADLMCSALRSYGVLEKSSLNPRFVELSKCFDVNSMGLTAHIKFSDEIGSDRFLLDRAAFSRILDNIIKNTREHCGEHAILQITVSRVNATTCDILMIDFTDDGPGIATEFREAIFEPGERAGKDLHYKDGGGLGLGLSISRTLAVSHTFDGVSGDLALLRSTKDGSTFRLTIPGIFE